jgi:hypothetical protein
VLKVSARTTLLASVALASGVRHEKGCSFREWITGINREWTMSFDRIRLEKTSQGKFVIIVQGTYAERPSTKGLGQMSKEDTTKELYEMRVPEEEIERMFARAESAARVTR